jgi:predicted  nucleic acid-binding Zn-ribbon protein
MPSIFELKFDISGNFSKKGAYSITDLEQKVYDSINDLYTNYAKYIKCNGSPNCDVKIEKLENLLGGANDSIKYFNDAIKYIQDNLSGTQNNDDFAKLKKNYENVIQSRADIDNKLDELIHTNTSHSSKTNFVNIRHNDSIYAGVLLTAFATSMLYFLFFKMK